MNNQFESKIIHTCVARRTRSARPGDGSLGKLCNSGRRSGARHPASAGHTTAITFVSRLSRPHLDMDHFGSQLGSPSFNQRLPKLFC